MELLIEKFLNKIPRAEGDFDFGKVNELSEKIISMTRNVAYPILGIIGLVVVIMLIRYFFGLIKSQEPEKRKVYIKSIAWTLVGLIGIGIAFALSEFIINFYKK